MICCVTLASAVLERWLWNIEPGLFVQEGGQARTMDNFSIMDRSPYVTCPLGLCTHTRIVVLEAVKTAKPPGRVSTDPQWGRDDAMAEQTRPALNVTTAV